MHLKHRATGMHRNACTKHKLEITQATKTESDTIFRCTWKHKEESRYLKELGSIKNMRVDALRSLIDAVDVHIAYVAKSSAFR